MWELLRPRRALRAIYRALVEFGMLYIGPEPQGMVASHRDAGHREGESVPVTGPPPGPLTGPPAGHPERLCADVPLTPLERELVREWELGAG
ncbi:DUF6059 family protein [Streptomyces sp. NPDC002671]